MKNMESARRCRKKLKQVGTVYKQVITQKYMLSCLTVRAVKLEDIYEKICNFVDNTYTRVDIFVGMQLLE